MFHERELLEIISQQAKTTNELVGIINWEEHKKRHHHHRVRLVIFQSFNNINYIAMSVTLPSNQKAPIVVGLVDSTTLQPVTFTATGTTNTSDNSAVFTVDADGNVVGVAAGTANLLTTSTVTYTDSNTQQSVTATLNTTTVVIISAVVTAESVQLAVTLGTPVGQ